MRFGVALPTYPKGATVEGFVKVAQAAEELGFVSAWTTDHVIMPVDQAGAYAEIFEPLMSLAYLAALTERVKLGISVIVVPQRNGIVLAKELATLDQLSRGRLIVGVGAGWNEDEFRMLDAADRFKRRGAYLDETIEVWHHLWSSPEKPFKGRFYDLPAVAFAPGTYSTDGPPIWVGGPSEGARRRAGRFGAAWHPVGMTAQAIAEQYPLVKQAAEEAGRPAPEIAPRLPVHVGDASYDPSTTRRHHTLDGEPEKIVEQIREYEQVGVAEIVCLFGSPDGSAVVNQMRRFQGEVMPAFQD
jgi:probable F420-dependent oxidoreductase